MEAQIQQLRSGLLQVLNGERPVPVTMVGPVQFEKPLQAIEELPTAAWDLPPPIE